MDEQVRQLESTFSARLDDLQVKIAFLDDLVESLNQMVASQQQTILDLQKQMQLLYQKLESYQSGEEGVEPFDPLKEIPPHY
ncbi:SlyX family protein [Alkanindiges sp. WGS2144]|uniref:SlyX family protein n=1 Tax=Alkanindiges sp. WGS2144 TaxID=3366808 RepID=UPI003753C125